MNKAELKNILVLESEMGCLLFLNFTYSRQLEVPAVRPALVASLSSPSGKRHEKG